VSKARATMPRVNRFRAGMGLNLLGLPVAVVAQSERLPLVAVVALAVALAPVAGRIGRQRLGFDTSHLAVGQRYVGDVVSLKTVVTNLSSGTSPVLTVTQTSPGLQLRPFTVPPLRPGEATTVSQQVLLAHRRAPAAVAHTATGHHRLLGSGSRSITALAPDPLFGVRPRPVLPPAELVELLSRPSDEGRGTGRRGPADPLSLRQFASGDPVSSVHWRSTARAGTPVVMEREQLAAGVLVLLVASTGQGEGWEAAIGRAAGLVQAASTLGVPVEVLAAGPAQAPIGAPSHETVQDWLARLDQAGAAGPELVGMAVRRASGGLIAVLSREPNLALAVVQAGAASRSVLDLVATSW
jgi:uncharacterized protein (DUF58 family)